MCLFACFGALGGEAVDLELGAEGTVSLLCQGDQQSGYSCCRGGGQEGAEGEVGAEGAEGPVGEVGEGRHYSEREQLDQTLQRNPPILPLKRQDKGPKQNPAVSYPITGRNPLDNGQHNDPPSCLPAKDNSRPINLLLPAPRQHQFPCHQHLQMEGQQPSP